MKNDQKNRPHDPYLRSIKYSLPEANPSWADNTDLTEDEQQEMMAEAISYEEGE